MQLTKVHPRPPDDAQTPERDYALMTFRLKLLRSAYITRGGSHALRFPLTLLPTTPATSMSTDASDERAAKKQKTEEYVLYYVGLDFLLDCYAS